MSNNHVWAWIKIFLSELYSIPLWQIITTYHSEKVLHILWVLIYTIHTALNLTRRLGMIFIHLFIYLSLFLVFKPNLQTKVLIVFFCFSLPLHFILCCLLKYLLFLSSFLNLFYHFSLNKNMLGKQVKMISIKFRLQNFTFCSIYMV